jgi:hypothetical protein
VAKKDYNAPKHEDLQVPNLEVIKAMQSLTSKGYVKTQFSWQWYYYVLTPEGVDYLREWCVPLSIPSRVLVLSHLGCTSQRKLSPLHTRRLHGLLVLPVPVVLVKGHTVRHVVTERIIGRRKVRRENSGHSSLALDGVDRRIKCQGGGGIDWEAWSRHILLYPVD